jgi:tRNA threonylcarbamoyl adenosine modification protein (Sua5/YciO/YrdC/YwlC family)
MRLAIHPLNPEPRLIERAVDVLRSGGIIIYPTDTVYGIGCSIESKNAIEKIHLIKHQKQGKPFSFVCSGLTNVSEYALVSNMAFRTMKHLIPGPYTFILPAAKMRQFPKILVSKRRTVGIRVPDSPIALALVSGLGHPVLSTSVTLEDGTLLNEPDEIVGYFNNRVEMIIDAGPLHTGPSTVIDLTGEQPEILREGSGDVAPLS